MSAVYESLTDLTAWSWRNDQFKYVWACNSVILYCWLGKLTISFTGNVYSM